MHQSYTQAFQLIHTPTAALKVGDLPHAKDMFKKLIKIHQNTNFGVTFHQLSVITYPQSSAADAQLTAMKKQIDQEFFAFILLHSLPDDNIWESFCATVSNSLMPGKPLAFSELSDHLTFTATA
ncbi:hypothetical protein C0989_002039 [Termitomyces sp. Mn162]|nr:hypothetical protein C0989_002039 [Termitomyces sp. Mn162]